MTIKDYIKTDEDFDIYTECELDFADPENSKEAIDNINWVLENTPEFEALAVVVRSYYGHTINW